MAELTDLELLSSLRVALAPPPIRPDDATMARLHEALAKLDVEDEPIDFVAAARRNVRHANTTRRARRTVGRSSIVAISALAAALSVGVAAAAVATNTLPGPTRAVAYDLGLPVTSPSLFSAQRSATELRQAILAKDLPQERVLGQQLIGELKTLNYSDLSEIRSTADRLLVQVGLSLPSASNAATRPLTPTDTIHVVTIPHSGVPRVSVPSVSVPSTVPSVRIPIVTVPALTVPSVGVPKATLPRVTVPSVGTPKVTLPNIPLPKVTIP
jgi:hypothetical protein